jgi:hypothetical protein
MYRIRLFSRLVALLALIGFSVLASAATLFSVRSNENNHLYSIDAATGIATDLGLIAFDDAEGLSFAGTTLYAIGGSVDEFWNITVPPGVLVGPTGPRVGTDAGLSYDVTTGTMYNINAAATGALYTINLATGAATLVGDSAAADGLGIDSSGNAFGIDGLITDSLYSIDLSTGDATLIGGLGLGDISLAFGLTFAEGTLYGLSDNGNIYSLNTSTGAATLVSSTTCGGVECAGWEGLAALQVLQLPEPGTLALVGIVLIGLVFSGRKQHAALVAMWQKR